MATSDLQTTINDMVAKIGQYIEDAATLTVETRSVDVSATPQVPFDQARPIAKSTLSLDGDVTVVVPVHEGDSGPEVEAAFFDLHERNVKMATEYRAQLLGAFIGALQSLVRRP